MLRVFALAVLLGISFASNSQTAIPAVARVTDQTGTLTAGQKAALERMLEEFEKKKGSQIAVLLVPTTAPETIDAYALRVAEQWKLGRKGVDDGALLVVAKNDRAMRIEVGYGLEGALNDATAKRIVSEVMAPRFREGDFSGGISAAVDRMIRVIDGEPLPAPARGAPTASGMVDGNLFQLLPVLLVAALAIGSVLRAMMGRALGSVAAGGAVGFLAWLLAGTLVAGLIAGFVALLFTLLGGMGGGRRAIGFPGGLGGGGFGGGGHRGGGGFGGGGFGGGGGGFGGGGASGRW